MRQYLNLICVGVLLAGAIAEPRATLAQETAAPISGTVRQTHAHNDYEHPRPLLDALDQGFASVEADVYLVDGQLLVAHDRADVSSTRTLAGLYLDPIRKRIGEHGGSVHGDEQPFVLLIDIKSDGETTYQALDELLTKYDDVLTHVTDAAIQKRPVVAIVSGNRAMKLIEDDSSRFVGIDGRLSDLSSDQPAHLMPLISDHWGRNFSWKGEGKMPEDERTKLNKVIRTAHASGRQVRFWATPDRESVWKVLKEAGVDLINTDDLVGLSKFVRSQ